MTKKKKIFIAVLVLIVLFLLFLFIWWLLLKQPSTKKTIVVNNPIENQVFPRGNYDQGTPLLTEQQVKVSQSGLESLALAFTERYGSFSSDSDLANLKDVLNFMSADLRQQTENYIDSVKPTTSYYGVTTKVLSVKVTSLDDAAGLAEVAVSTQREESKGGPQDSSTRYQILLLNFQKESGLWKVDSAVWQ